MSVPPGAQGRFEDKICATKPSHGFVADVAPQFVAIKPPEDGMARARCARRMSKFELDFLSRNSRVAHTPFQNQITKRQNTHEAAATHADTNKHTNKHINTNASNMQGRKRAFPMITALADLEK